MKIQTTKIYLNNSIFKVFKLLRTQFKFFKKKKKRYKPITMVKSFLKNIENSPFF